MMCLHWQAILYPLMCGRFTSPDILQLHSGYWLLAFQLYLQYPHFLGMIRKRWGVLEAARVCVCQGTGTSTDNSVWGVHGSWNTMDARNVIIHLLLRIYFV